MAVVNAMTVDVEDYFQVSAFDRTVPRESWSDRESRVEANTERLLALFADAGVTATFFVLGWIAERHPALVRRIVAAGHELASHGYAHRLVYEQSPAAFREDLRRSRDVLEATGAVRVRAYRAPSFSIVRRSLWALDVLVEEGFEYDASIFPIHHDRYGIPGSPRYPYRLEAAGGTLTETPGSTIRLGPLTLPVAGGGYFRLLPYVWTRWGIGRLNRREGQPAVFYIHPWELDPEQPRLPVNLLGRVRHYTNLTRTEPRLRQLLEDFAFGPLVAMARSAESTVRPASSLGEASSPA